MYQLARGQYQQSATVSPVAVAACAEGKDCPDHPMETCEMNGNQLSNVVVASPFIKAGTKLAGRIRTTSILQATASSPAQ